MDYQDYVNEDRIACSFDMHAAGAPAEAEQPSPIVAGSMSYVSVQRSSGAILDGILKLRAGVM